MCAAYKMHHMSSVSYAALLSASVCETQCAKLRGTPDVLRLVQNMLSKLSCTLRCCILQPKQMSRKSDCSRMLHLMNGSCMFAGFQRTSFHELFLAIYRYATSPACWRLSAWNGICAIIQHPSVVMTQLHSTGAIWALYYATSGTAILACKFDQVLLSC